MTEMVKDRLAQGSASAGEAGLDGLLSDTVHDRKFADT
jgi:hypothetical protein